MNALEIALNALACIVVSTAMWIILTKFLKRLKEIEIESWGDKSSYRQDDSILSAIKWIFGRKKKLIKGDKGKSKQ